MVTLNINVKNGSTGNTGGRHNHNGDHSKLKNFNGGRNSTGGSSSPLSLIINQPSNSDSNKTNITIQENRSNSDNQYRNRTTNGKSSRSGSSSSLVDAFRLGATIAAKAVTAQNSATSLMNLLGASNSGYGNNGYGLGGSSNSYFPYTDPYSSLGLNSGFGGYNDSNSYDPFGFNSFTSGMYSDPLSSLGLGIGGYGSNPFGSNPFNGVSNSLVSLLSGLLDGNSNNSNNSSNSWTGNCNSNRPTSGSCGGAYNTPGTAITLEIGGSSATIPAGFTKAADGKTASLAYGNNSIAFNQADQSVVATDKTTGKSIRIWGDPHGPDGDFKGTKTYKLPDGTSMTLKTAPQSGVTDPNAQTFVQSATFSKKGLDSVRVNNITAPTSGAGINAETLDRREARQDKNAAVNMVSYNANYEKIA